MAFAYMILLYFIFTYSSDACFSRSSVLAIVRNPQLITLQLLSTHHRWANLQRNLYCYVIILEHFDKSRRLSL